MALYLRRRHPTLPPHLIPSLSAAYALCGFALAYQSNTKWFDALILLPLTLRGLEDLVYRRTPFLYTVALALTLLTNYYMGYMTALFCSLFFLYICIFEPQDSKHKFIDNATLFILFSVLSVLIASVILFPAVYSLSFEKSDFIPPAQRGSILATLADLLRKSLHADSIRFFSALGISARWHRSDYASPNPFADSLLGIRYVLSDEAIPFYTPRFTESGRTVHQNEHALPLVYPVANAASPDFDRNPAENCNLLADHLLGTAAPDIFVPIPTDLTLFGGCQAFPSEEGTTVYLPDDAESTAFVTLTATAEATGDVFFTLPSPIPTPVYFYVNDDYQGVRFDTAAPIFSIWAVLRQESRSVCA